MYINGYLILVQDLTTDLAASEGHTSSHVNGNIRIELKFRKTLLDAVSWLLYMEYDNSVRIDLARTVSTDF
jgi:hypothetical protein